MYCRVSFYPLTSLFDVFMKICISCGRENPDNCTWCPECGTDQPIRKAPPAELLLKVIDRASFIEFVTALAEERAEAEKLEREDPGKYQLGGAHDWQNAKISDYLYASLAYFDTSPEIDAPGSTAESPSWQTFASILYFGKMYE